MKIDELVAISGMPGLYKIGASRNNGMIVEDLDTGKSRFVSMRKHQFTPLGTVAIYTEMDTKEINAVFETMAEKEADNPIPELSSSSKELFAYFETVLPDYDKDQVLVSDVKKVIKWYRFLTQRNLFPFEKDPDSTSDDNDT